MPTKVKICGLTNSGDARAALDFGADYLGFIGVENSPRYVSPERYAGIVSSLPASASPVVVVKRLKDAARYRAASVQYYDLDDAEIGDSLDLWPALRPRNEARLNELLAKIPSRTRYVLIDAFIDGKLGGAGVLGDWSLTKIAVNSSPKPVFLAGGLTAENVEEAVGSVSPFGVDVSSGVEESIRKKSLSKMREFLRRAKNA